MARWVIGHATLLLLRDRDAKCGMYTRRAAASSFHTDATPRARKCGRRSTLPPAENVGFAPIAPRLRATDISASGGPWLSRARSSRGTERKPRGGDPDGRARPRLAERRRAVHGARDGRRGARSTSAPTASSSCSRSSWTCTASRTPSSSRPRTSTTCSTDGAGFAGFAAGDIGQQPNSPDMVAMPDIRSLTPLPFRPGVARFACDVHVEGEEWPYCPRTILRRQLDRGQGARLRVQDRRRARVLPRAQEGGRHDRARRPARHPRPALLRHARPDAQPRLRRRRSRATSRRSGGTTTRPTTRTPTASSSRTSSSPTR